MIKSYLDGRRSTGDDAAFEAACSADDLSEDDALVVGRANFYVDRK